MAARKFPLPPTIPWRRRTTLRKEYLQRYDQYSPFMEEITGLYASLDAQRFFATPVGDLRYIARDGPYRQRVEAFAARWGLDRFGVSFRLQSHSWPSDGEELVHRWLKSRALADTGTAWTPSPPPADPNVRFRVLGIGISAPPGIRDAFSAAYSGSRPSVFSDPAEDQQHRAYGRRPKVGEPVTVVTDVIEDENGERQAFSYEATCPVVHIHLDEPVNLVGWAGVPNFAIESPQAARTRLLTELKRQVNDELERIVGEMEDAGYVFEDVRTAQDQHLAWTFKHIALGQTYPDIAAHDKALRDRSLAATVQRAVATTAATLGISLRTRQLKPSRLNT